MKLCEQNPAIDQLNKTSNQFCAKIKSKVTTLDSGNTINCYFEKYLSTSKGQYSANGSYLTTPS